MKVCQWSNGLVRCIEVSSLFVVVEDEAVLSGSLVWKEAPADYPRTTALFTLTLALSPEYYSNSSVGDTVYMPGQLSFGDENEMDSFLMKVNLHTFLKIHYDLLRCCM